MNVAKLQLSPEETALVNNAAVLLTKNRILQEVELFFAALAKPYQQLYLNENPLPPEALTALPPKISRGENYQGLPYRILDYPRCFEKEDVFACRSFFWWGHFMSVTLHLKGQYLKTYASQVVEKAVLAKQDFRIALEGDEWDHDARNYTALSATSREGWLKKIPQASFCKVSVILELGRWDTVSQAMLDSYRFFWEACSTQFPKR